MSPNRFELQLNLPRVVFGAGSLKQLPAEIERLGAQRALVLATPEQEGVAAQGVVDARRSARPACSRAP